MKKLLTILICLLISVSLFATEDVRSMGMGGLHVTDYSDIYTLDKNPASLGFSDKHNLWINTQFNVSGPLSEIGTAANDIINSMESSEMEGSEMESTESSDSTNELVGQITDIVSKNNGLTVNLDVVPLLNFGFIKNGFGLLLSTNIYTDVDIPSVNSVGINLGLNGNIKLGYGYKFDFGANDIAIGVSGDFFSNFVDVGIKGSLTELMSLAGGSDNSENSNSSVLDNIPITSMKGFSLTSGLHYRYSNFLNVGIVWNNMLSSTNTTNATKVEGEITSFAPDYSNGTKGKLDSKLAVGIGVKVPVNFIITSMNIYLDHENVFDFFPSDKLVRNPILGLSAGLEAVLLKTFSLRLGINESYLAAGVGVRLGSFNIDAAVYGSELGLEPGDRPQLNTSISIAFRK